MGILYNQDKSFNERVRASLNDKFAQNAIKTAQNVF